MKAETVIVTINARSVLKILLLPEDEQERTFLAKAWDECVDHDVSYKRTVDDAQIG